MTMLHVVPDERGNWCVLEDAVAAPLSEHPSATHAEAAAWAYAEARGADAILVHDRYHRCRRAVGYPALHATRPRRVARAASRPR
jgi:hypothetical protein